MTTDDLRTRAREAAEGRYSGPQWHVGTIRERQVEAYVEGYLAHAAQQPSRDEPIGWDDRKELADVFQDAGARFPVEGLSDDLYSGLLAVARWGAEQPRYPHAAQQPSRESLAMAINRAICVSVDASCTCNVYDEHDLAAADAVLALLNGSDR